jgi:hypothetical protein
MLPSYSTESSLNPPEQSLIAGHFGSFSAHFRPHVPIYLLTVSIRFVQNPTACENFEIFSQHWQKLGWFDWNCHEDGHILQ